MLQQYYAAKNIQGGSDISGTLSKLHCRIKNVFKN
jgi:hypothetical protein